MEKLLHHWRIGLEVQVFYLEAVKAGVVAILLRCQLACYDGKS